MAQDQFDKLPTYRARTTVYNPNEDKWGYQTATGVRSQEGHTVAVDPTVIPYGRYIQLLNEDGTPWNDPSGNFGIRKAVDTGSAVKSRKASGGKEPVIDLFFEGDLMENQKKIGDYANYRILPEDYVPNFEEDKNIKKAEPVEQPKNKRPFFGDYEFEDVVSDDEFLALPARNKLTAYNAWLRDYESVVKDNIPAYTPEKFLEYKKSLSAKIQPILKDKSDKIQLDKKPYDFGLNGETKLDQFRIKDEGQKDLQRTLDIAEASGDLTAEEREALQAKIVAEQEDRTKVDALNIAKYLVNQGEATDINQAFESALVLSKSDKEEDRKRFEGLAKSLATGTGEAPSTFGALGNAVMRGSKAAAAGVSGFGAIGANLVGAEGLAKDLISFQEKRQNESEMFPESLPIAESKTTLGKIGAGVLTAGEKTAELTTQMIPTIAAGLAGTYLAPAVGMGAVAGGVLGTGTASFIQEAGGAYQGKGNEAGAIGTGLVNAALEMGGGLAGSAIKRAFKGVSGKLVRPFLEGTEELIKKPATSLIGKAYESLAGRSIVDITKELGTEELQELNTIRNEKQSAGLPFSLDEQDYDRLKKVAIDTVVGLAPLSVAGNAFSRKVNANLTRKVEAANQAAKDFTTARSQLIDSGMTPEEADKIVADTTNLDKLFTDLNIVSLQERQTLIDELSRKEGISVQEATNAYVAKREQEAKAQEELTRQEAAKVEEAKAIVAIVEEQRREKPLMLMAPAIVEQGKFTQAALQKPNEAKAQEEIDAYIAKGNTFNEKSQKKLDAARKKDEALLASARLKDSAPLYQQYKQTVKNANAITNKVEKANVIQANRLKLIRDLSVMNGLTNEQENSLYAKYSVGQINTENYIQKAEILNKIQSEESLNKFLSKDIESFKNAKPKKQVDTSVRVLPTGETIRVGEAQEAVEKIRNEWNSLIVANKLRKEIIEKSLATETNLSNIDSLRKQLDKSNENDKFFKSQLNSKTYAKNASAIFERLAKINKEHFDRVNDSKKTIEEYFKKINIDPKGVKLVNSVESILIRAAQDPSQFNPEFLNKLADLQSRTEGFTNFDNVSSGDMELLTASNDLSIWNPAFVIPSENQIYVVADPLRLNYTLQKLRSVFAHEKAHIYLNGIKSNMTPESWRVFLDKINANMTEQNADLTAFDTWLQKEKGIDGRIGLAEEYAKLQNNPNISKEDMVTEELLTNYIEFVTAEEDARSTGLFGKMRDVTDNIATVVGMRSEEILSTFNFNGQLIKEAVQKAPDIAVMNWVDNSYSTKEVEDNKPINDLKDIILNESLKTNLKETNARQVALSKYQETLNNESEQARKSDEELRLKYDLQLQDALVNEKKRQLQSLLNEKLGKDKALSSLNTVFDKELEKREKEIESERKTLQRELELSVKKQEQLRNSLQKQLQKKLKQEKTTATLSVEEQVDVVQDPVVKVEQPLVIQEAQIREDLENPDYIKQSKAELIEQIKAYNQSGIKRTPDLFLSLKKAKDELNALNRYEAMKAMDEVLFADDPQGMTREEFMAQRLQDRTKAYELLTGRGFGSVQYALPFYGDQMVIDNGKFQYVDYLGGFAYGRVNPDGVANISIMSSVPSKFLNTPAQDTFKGRGFFRTLIRRFLKNGVTKVEMPLQTEDTIKTVQGLLNKGELVNPSKPVTMGGVEIPTQFDINNQIQYALPSNYQESFDDAMLDNYSGALEDFKRLMDEHPERAAEIAVELIEETTGQPIQYALPSIRGDLVSNMPSLMQAMITDFGFINNAELRDKTNISFLALAREKKAASMEALQFVKDLKGIGLRGQVLMNKIGWKRKADGNVDLASPENIAKQKDITIALAGEPTIGQLSVEEQNLVKEMRALLKEKAALMVANGMMTESDAREIEALGGYVPRYFNKYTSVPFTSGKASIFKKAGKREIGSLTRGWTIIDGDEYVSVWSTEDKARAELKRLKALPENVKAKLRYEKPTTTRELIEVAGSEQIEFNPAVWFPMYMAEINIDIAKHRFIQQFADSLKLEGKLLTKEEVDKLPPLDQEEYKLVSGEQSGDNFGVKKYGDLAGMYIPLRAHEMITRTFENSRNEAWETWKGIIDLWAVGKTAFSPSTFMANIASTVINSFTLGVTPANPSDWGYFGQALDLAWEAGMKGEISPKIIELVRAGVVSRASMNGELVNELEVTRKNLQQAIIEKKPFNVLTAFSEAFDVANQSFKRGRPSIALKAIRESYPVQKVMAFYGLVDDVIKIAAYLKRIKQGDTKEQATAYIHRYGINYDTVPQNKIVTGYKYLGNRFYSFTHQFGGVMANLTQDAVKGSPITGKKEFDKLGTMILLTALPMFLHQIGMAMSDESDESKEDIEAKMAQDSLINKFAFIPENIRKPLAIFGSGKAYVDPALEASGVKDLLGLEKNYLMKFSRYIPSLDMFGSRFADAVSRGEDGAISSISRSLLTGSPIFKVLAQSAFNTNAYTGKAIVAKGTPDLEAAKQITEMAALEFAPTILTSLYMNQNADKLGSVNQKREVPVTWLKTMGGIDLEMADPTDYEIAKMSRRRRGLPEEVQGKYVETYQDRLTKQLVLAIKNGDFEEASELRKKIQELGVDAEGNPLTGKALKDYVLTNKELNTKLKNLTPLRFAGQKTKDRNALRQDIEKRGGISKRSMDMSMDTYQKARQNLPAFQAYERANP